MIVFLITLGILAVFGIITLLPLRISLYTSILMLIGGLSYFVIVPIIEHGVFMRGFFFSALIVATLFIWVTINNSRTAKAEQIRRNEH